MQKKIFAACCILACAFVFLKTQKYFICNNVSVLKAENREELMEVAFPYGTLLKEIYGYSNRVISPNEKISGAITTIKDKDGYLQPIYMANTGVVAKAKSKILELDQICRQEGVKFSFISYPSKTNSTTLPTTYGVDTNYEEIRKNFLDYLDKNNVDHLNVRELLENDGYTTKDIFYKTDHHWKTTAGFYAARAIAEYLNETYNWNLNSGALDKDKFTFTTYHNLWFGEEGRNLSRAWVGALDDFIQIMPNYDTSITLQYPDKDETSGDFSELVDSSGYDGNVDYYRYSAHYSYEKGMGSSMTYHNNLADENGKKILLIKDSFSVVVIPFLILETSDITVWDMRLNKDGLYQYIRDNDFDVVLLAYTDFWRDDMWNFN